MDRLPKKHLVPDPPQVDEMRVGDVRWVSNAKVDHEGVMYLSKRADVREKAYPGPVGGRYELKVERLEGGWKVSIPRSSLPLKPTSLPAVALKVACVVVTDIEIFE